MAGEAEQGAGLSRREAPPAERDSDPCGQCCGTGEREDWEVPHHCAACCGSPLTDSDRAERCEHLGALRESFNRESRFVLVSFRILKVEADTRAARRESDRCACATPKGTVWPREREQNTKRRTFRCAS